MAVMRARAALVFMVVLTMVLAVPVGRAAALDDYVYGDVSAQVTIKISGARMLSIKGNWYQCTVVGLWKVADGVQYLTISGGCERGWSAEDKQGWFYADVPDCGRARVNVGDLDSKEEVGSFADLTLRADGLNETGQGCGAPTLLCLTGGSDPVNATLTPGDGTTHCVAWNVGPPPGEPETPAGTCPRGTALEPWIEEIHPEAVSGGWAWVSEGAVRFAEHTPAAEAGTAAATVGGDPMYVFGYVRISASSTTTMTLVAPMNGYGWAATGGSGSRGATVSMDARTDPTIGRRWDSPVTQAEFRIVGPTLTTAFGSGVPSWSYQRVGFYATGGINDVFTGGNLGGSDNTPDPTEYAANDGRRYAGTHYPAFCDYVWGTASAGSPTAAITYQDVESTPPPPYVPPNLTPPDIYVGPGESCPSGAVCVDPPANVDPDDENPPSLPDPEDSSCDFSITDPGTWGGQVICALVAIAKAIIGAIGSVLEFLAGLLGQLADLLLTLFVPDPSSWGLDGLLTQLQSRAPFSIFTELATSATTAAGEYTDGCSGGLEYEIEGIDAPSLSCDTITSVPGMSEARALVGVALICWTAWIIWGQLGDLYKPR